MKKLPVRTENAITNLYTAFHNDELDSYNCSHCAVGSMCDNDNDWAEIRDHAFAAMNLNVSVKAIKTIEKTGYTPFEIYEIEKIFITEVPFELRQNKEAQFKGLCAVIEYLCELDGVDNVMEIQSLFEYKEGVKELNEVIQ